MITLSVSPLTAHFQSGSRSLRPLLFVASFIFFWLVILTNNYIRSSATTAKADILGDGVLSRPLTLFDDVYNTTLGFEHVFAITMPDRNDQRDSLTLASSLTGFNIEFADGVKVDAVDAKTLPGRVAESLLGTGSLAAWRAHIDVLQEIVSRGLSSTLIFEGDVDWDVRIKDQLLSMAVSSHAVQHAEGAELLDFYSLPFTGMPTTSPYGDDWELLWLGHCATTLNDSEAIVVHENDATVPRADAIFSLGGVQRDQLQSRFPPHTRVVTRGVKEGCCTIAYAVTQAGARRLLYDVGMKKLAHPFDVSVANWCEGKDGEDRHKCIGVMPQLFDSHRKPGSIAADSDIDNGLDKTRFREKGVTQTVRWSTMLNLEMLLKGETDYHDQYPDLDGGSWIVAFGVSLNMI